MNFFQHFSSFFYSLRRNYSFRNGEWENIYKLKCLKNFLFFFLFVKLKSISVILLKVFAGDQSLWHSSDVINLSQTIGSNRAAQKQTIMSRSEKKNARKGRVNMQSVFAGFNWNRFRQPDSRILGMCFHFIMPLLYLIQAQCDEQQHFHIFKYVKKKNIKRSKAFKHLNRKAPKKKI